MDYTNLINDNSGKNIKSGNHRRDPRLRLKAPCFAQIPKAKHMYRTVISSRHTDECLDVLKEIGYDEKHIVVCQDKEQIDRARRTRS